MSYISPSKIEDRAISVLKNVVNKHDTIDCQFNSRDKEMSWDGFIYDYKIENGDHRKKNFAKRIAVQIKGHLDNNHDFIGKDRIRYPVSLDDLRIYNTENGVMYFQIFIDDSNESEVFYASLLPSKITSILKKAIKKGNKKEKTITFFKLEQDPFKLELIIKQFSLESSKQGSGYNDLVINMIGLNEIDNIESIRISTPFPLSTQKTFDLLSTGTLCLYGKRNGSDYYVPIEWDENIKFGTVVEINMPIIVMGREYYHTVKKLDYIDGKTAFVLSDNLILRAEDCTFEFRGQTTLKQIAHDAEFLLALVKSSYYYLGDLKFDLSDLQMTSNFEDRLKNIVELNDILNEIKIDNNFKLKLCNENDFKNFSNIIQIKRGVFEPQLSGNKTGLYDWEYHDKIVPIVIKKIEGVYALDNAIYGDKYAYYVRFDGHDKCYRVPNFIALSSDRINK